MRTKQAAKLGWGCIIAGGIFLFEPFVSVFDILPDFVGYLLILHGLQTLSLLEGHLEAATRCFRRLALLSVGRLLSLLVVFGLMPATEQPVGHLLFTFTLGILDCIVLIPAWRELTQGLTQSAYLFGGSAILTSDRHGRSRTDRFLRFTLIFMVLKEIMSVLPEVSVLFNSMSGEIQWSRWNFLYNYVGLLRLFAAVLVLIFGIVWLVKLIRYIGFLRRDTAYQESLRDAVGQYMELHPDHMPCRAIRSAVFWLGAASILCADIFADGVSVLPDAVAAACILVAVILLRRADLRENTTIAASVGFLVTSALAGFKRSAFLHELCEGSLMNADQYTATHNSYMLENAARMLKDSDSRTEFYVVCGLVALAQVCLILTLLSLRRTLHTVIDRYTGLPRGHENDPRLVGGDEDIHAALRRSLLISTIIGCVAAVLPVIYMLTLPYAVGTPLQFFSAFNLIADAVFAASFVKLLKDIRGQMENRYLLD